MTLKPVRQALSRIIDAPPDDFEPGDGATGGGDGRPPMCMPEGCPVVPLGTQDNVFYFLTALGEVRGLTADKVANKHIVGMFAPRSYYLRETWPRKTEVVVKTKEGKIVKDDEGNKITEWVITGFRNDDVAALLMDCAGECGIWNPLSKVRGTGAWRGADGGLILHTGKRLLIDGRWREPGRYDGLVYPGMDEVPRPCGRAEARLTGEELAPQLAATLRARLLATGGRALNRDLSPAGLLLEFFKTWNWERPGIDPYLLIGWIGAAMIGGALHYRPLAWITGDAATGKTTLQRVTGLIFNGGILQSAKASEAGVRQVLGQRSLPVALDETEATEDNRKLLELVTLARLAATSQGQQLKGGQDHKGHEFRSEACFLFSSILVPPMPPADKSRLAMLELNELPAGARDPVFDDREINAIGAWMLRRMVDGWSDWRAVLSEFREALVDIGGHKGRGADQFGTLLAAQHMLLWGAELEEGDSEGWASMLAAPRLAETAGQESDAQLCVRHLRTSLVQIPGHGLARLVSEWVLQASAPEPPSTHLQQEFGQWREARAAADKMLGRVGMKVMGRATGDPEKVFLAVASSHQGLARQFSETRWAGGTWSQALGRIKGARRGINTRIAGDQAKAVWVPLAAVVTRDEDDDEAEVSDAHALDTV